MASSAVAGGSAESLLESFFLVLVYGFVMFRGSKLANEGRQALLKIFTPGITSAMFLSLASSLPTAIVILVSGLRGSKSSAQDQIFIGMGSLAGSTIMLLTLLWGSCIIAHIKNGYAVKTDSEVSHTARIMIISALPFIIVQLLLVLRRNIQVRLLILISMIVSMALFISYGLYQIFSPWIQGRRLAFVHHNDVISLGIPGVHGLDRLLSDSGEPNVEALHKLFKALDSDSDGLLSAAELRALILGVQFEEIDLGIDEPLRKHLKDKIVDENSKMDKDEFISFMSKWLEDSRHSLLNLKRLGDGVIAAIKFKHLLLHRRRITLLSGQSDGAGGSGHSTTTHSPLIQSRDEVVIPIKNPISRATVAALKLLWGALIVAASAYPLVDVVDNFSAESSIPSFSVSFVVTPLACYSWIWSALLLAGKKKTRMLSLTFSEIYEAVTVNNTFCFAVFLAIVYARDLTWKFSSEALVTLVVTILVGLIAGFKTDFPLWTSISAYVLYPLSLALAYLLSYVLGFS
ncbi:sodium/calcium exchanger NCL1-like [Punica granatum]|uniref:Uncharacterized protein n=2 Tax=Punica granatum TaxID=22663 RepID=A0A2I0IFJ1_PUNGR|nr:sodium/calcium exchanger NCL1-like [Punica granatum]PKI42747.1 hypothetical protein CRG98_036875 [Punica granatum]